MADHRRRSPEETEASQDSPAVVPQEETPLVAAPAAPAGEAAASLVSPEVSAVAERLLAAVGALIVALQEDPRLYQRLLATFRRNQSYSSGPLTDFLRTLVEGVSPPPEAAVVAVPEDAA